MMSTQPIKRTMYTEPKRAQRLQAVCESASAVVGSPFCFCSTATRLKTTTHDRISTCTCLLAVKNEFALPTVNGRGCGILVRQSSMSTRDELDSMRNLTAYWPLPHSLRPIPMRDQLCLQTKRLLTWKIVEAVKVRYKRVRGSLYKSLRGSLVVRVVLLIVEGRQTYSNPQHR